MATLPRLAPKSRVDLARLLPSGRAVAIAVALAVLALGLYFLARESSMFAIRMVDVRGAPTGVATRVRAALAPFDGSSLATLDGARVLQRVEALPVVASARYDRDFPHTLRLFVRAEHPVAVIRRGSESWLVSARGRVMETLARGEHRDLPRIWVPRSVSLLLGGTVSGDAARGVGAVVPLGRTPLRNRVSTVRAAADELTLVLRSGLELRLGDATDLPLKLAIGARIARLVAPGKAYVDLAVPGRPVTNANPKVAG